jgi:hypothetical protein
MLRQEEAESIGKRTAKPGALTTRGGDKIAGAQPPNDNPNGYALRITE